METVKHSICIDCQHLDLLRKKCTLGRPIDCEIDMTKVASCGRYAALGEQDQTAKADKGKARITLVPMDIVWAIAAVREFGTAKYKDPDNWKRVDPQRFRDAMARHMLRYLADPTGVDDESGLPHLWHALCNGAFLCALDKQEV